MKPYHNCSFQLSSSFCLPCFCLLVEYKAERAAMRARLLVVVETSATRAGCLIRAERSVMRAGLLVGGFAGDVKIARDSPSFAPILCLIS